MYLLLLFSIFKVAIISFEKSCLRSSSINFISLDGLSTRLEVAFWANKSRLGVPTFKTCYLFQNKEKLVMKILIPKKYTCWEVWTAFSVLTKIYCSKFRIKLYNPSPPTSPKNPICPSTGRLDLTSQDVFGGGFPREAPPKTLKRCFRDGMGLSLDVPKLHFNFLSKTLIKLIYPNSTQYSEAYLGSSRISGMELFFESS